MEIIKILLPSLKLPIAGFILIVAINLIPKYITFRKSEYKDMSGNSFIQTIFNKGNYGEFLTFSYLEKLPTYKKLLTNIYAPKANGTTTEIDLVMIHETGIYVFESKNYSGWIFGDEKSKMWTQTLQNKQKNRFLNPIWQNEGHIKGLINNLPEIDQSLYKSYIVFSERCTLKKVTVYSPKVKIIKRQDLIKTIEKIFQNPV